MSANGRSGAEATSGAERVGGLDVAPGVLEQIVTLAAQAVDGVSCVDCSGISGFIQKAGRNRPVEVAISPEGLFEVKLHLSVNHGRPLRAIGADVQRVVADALVSQTSRAVACVDVCIDAIVFPVE